MKECTREREIVEAIASSRWPGACETGLRAHAATCPICSDVVTVAAALHEERAVALQRVRIPSAGLVWWRAELRARAEASRAAERPITLVQILAVACAVGVAFALAGALTPWVQELFISFSDLPRVGLVIAALVTLLIAAPVALYFVSSDE